MIYTIRHLTTYRYAAPVSSARCALRLVPAQGDGQTLLSSEIAVTPAPSARAVRQDFFGIETVTVTVDTPHREFSVEARSRVKVERPAEAGGPGGAWGEIAREALACATIGGVSPVHYAFPSRRIPLVPAVTDYARASFPAGRPIGEGARDLMHRIRADFTFDAEATTVSTPLAVAFAKRRGVCQDFAQIMIAGLRGLGLPAAYVSGYLRTVPPPGRPRMRGADVSHAWASVYTGEGWLGLDPTNDVAVASDHIVLASGRDYADVAPLDGIILVSGSQTLHVEVDVIPEGEPPPLAPP